MPLNTAIDIYNEDDMRAVAYGESSLSIIRNYNNQNKTFSVTRIIYAPANVAINIRSEISVPVMRQIGLF